MISYGQRPSSAAAISAISGATLPASLRTGTTMETSTAAASGDDKSALMALRWATAGPTGPEGLSASAYYGANALRATLLRCPSEGPASGSIAPSRRTVKARWRVANQEGTRIAAHTPGHTP